MPDCAVASARAAADWELTRASMAAYGAPRRAPFEPFQLFSWTQDTKPLGDVKCEAEDVAWFLSCVPWMSESCTDHTARALGYACHLRRERKDFETLYGGMVKGLDRLVHMSEVEAAIHGSWSEKDLWTESNVRRMDPYFFRVLQDVVSKSMQHYLDNLDSALCSLGSSAPLQETFATNQSMRKMIRSLVFHMTNALLRKETSKDDLCNVVSSACNGVVQDHVGKVKQHLKRQVAGLRSLGRLAACRDADLDSCLQDEQVLVAELCSDPPPELIEQLKSRRINFSELNDIFCSSATSLISTQVAPASFAVRASTLSRFLSLHRDAIAEVCVSTITTLQRVADIPVHSDEWCNVTLCLTSEAVPFDSDHVARWTSPSHLGKMGPNRVVVAAKTCSQIGTRSSRLVAVLKQQIRLGLLPAATFTSSAILPIVSRIAAEADVAYACTVDQSIRPVAAKHGLEWPEDAPSKRHHTTAAEQPVWNAPRAPERVVQPPKPQHSQSLDIFKVPEALERDFLILSGFCLMLQEKRQTVNATFSLDDIVAAVRMQSRTLAAQKDASLRQAVVWVINKVIDQCTSQAPMSQNSCKFSSTRDRASGGKIGGVICYGTGSEHLYQYVLWCINEMRYNGDEFLKTWRLSRSSRAKAIQAVKRGQA